nr:MAG TPA: hypothetical protein [Caudoviricetes sp.]
MSIWEKRGTTLQPCLKNSRKVCFIFSSIPQRRRSRTVIYSRILIFLTRIYIKFLSANSCIKAGIRNKIL